MTQPASEHACYLLSRFPPVWEYIDPLRRYVDVLARSSVPNVAERVGIVVQELLENAVKFGNPSVPIELRIDPEIHGFARSVEVRVSNTASTQRIALLQKEFERIGSSTASEAFARALERLKRLPQGSSMLGLSRIAAEARMTLQVSQDRVLIVARIA